MDAIIVLIALLPFGLLATFATLMFLVAIFTTVGSAGQRKNIMKHAEYDYYQTPGSVRLDDRS